MSSAPGTAGFQPARTSARKPVGNRRSRVTSFRVSIIFLLASLITAADVQVELSATPTTPAVGDPVVLQITYRWPRGWIATPDPGRELSGWFVTAAPPAEDRSSGNDNVKVFRYTILAERSGALALPRFALAAGERSGVDPVRASAPEVILQVGTGKAEPALPASRPAWTVPPPEERPATPWWVWAAVGVAVLAVVIPIAWWLLRRRIHFTTPEERFAQELARVRALTDARDRAAGVSLALRRFAGTAYGFDGVGATARETASFVQVKAPEDEATPLARLLDRLDGLRWTPEQLTAETMAPIETDAESWGEALGRRLIAERRKPAKVAA